MKYPTLMPKSQGLNLERGVKSSMTHEKRKLLVLRSFLWLGHLTVVILEWSPVASMDDTVVVLGSKRREKALGYRTRNPLAGMVWSATSLQTLGSLCLMWESLVSNHPRGLRFVGCTVLALSTILFTGAIACCYALYRIMGQLASNYTRGDGPQNLLILFILNLLCWLLLGLSHQLRQRWQGPRCPAQTNKVNSRPFDAKEDMAREHRANVDKAATSLGLMTPSTKIGFV